MERDESQFEWVNAWAALQTAEAAAADAAENALNAAEPVDPAEPVPVVEAPSVTAEDAVPLPDDQLMRDLAEIERARDALAAVPVLPRGGVSRTALFRTSDSVPVMIGGMLALLMLTVFSAAAAMSKLVR